MRVTARQHNVTIPGPREKPCKLCASLEHRVRGNRCRECGLAYLARVPVTMDYILELAGMSSR